MKVETFQAMGAVPVKDGIVFSMERKNNEEASLLLYKKGSKEVIQEIPFPATNTIGDIVCCRKRYFLYYFFIKKAVKK